MRLRKLNKIKLLQQREKKNLKKLKLREKNKDKQKKESLKYGDQKEVNQ